MTNQTKCTKCDGHGYIAAYKHIAGGQCFHCNGGVIGARPSLVAEKSAAKAVDDAWDDYLSDMEH